MKIEKLDRVVVYVDDLDAAKKLYSETLGISFDDLPRERSSNHLAISSAHWRLLSAYDGCHIAASCSAFATASRRRSMSSSQDVSSS